MRIDREPLYDLNDRLLGHSVVLHVSDIDKRALYEWDRGYRYEWYREGSGVAHAQYVARLRAALPNRGDRGIESYYSARDREDTVFYFRPIENEV